MKFVVYSVPGREILCVMNPTPSMLGDLTHHHVIEVFEVVPGEEHKEMFAAVESMVEFGGYDNRLKLLIEEVVLQTFVAGALRGRRKMKRSANPLLEICIKNKLKGRDRLAKAK